MAQRVTLAQTQLQIAQSNPALHNIREAYRRVYEALGTKQVDTLLNQKEYPRLSTQQLKMQRHYEWKYQKRILNKTMMPIL